MLTGIQFSPQKRPPQLLLILFFIAFLPCASFNKDTFKGPDITGKYTFVSLSANTTKTTFLITKSGSGIHLEGILDESANEASKGISKSQMANLTGDYVWVDQIGAYRNNFGRSTYHLYKVNNSTLALRSGSIEVGTFSKVEESLDQLAGTIRNDVSGLLGNWKVEGTTASIGLTSGVSNDLTVRYGTSIYELNKDEGGVFESYSGGARNGDANLTLQVVAKDRIKLNISGSTLYAQRKGQALSTGNATSSVPLSGPQSNTNGAYTPGSAVANPQNKLLFTAINAGDSDAIDELIAQGVNLNTKNTSGRTPLIATIYKEDMAMMEQLLESGANINAMDNQGRAPLIVAIQQSSAGNTAMVASLIERRPTISIQAIDESLKKNDLELIRLLLDADANKGHMAKRAIETGKVEVFDLVSNEYQLPLSNVLFDTALNYRKYAIADKMIAKGFSPVYALDASVKRDVVDLVYTALERGGNPNTALTYAVTKKETELAKMAVEDYGADPNKALPAAVTQNNVEIVGVLLANNAAPNSQMPVVGASGNLTLLDLFLTNGADADLALLPAAKNNKTQAVTLLLQNGADANKLIGYAIESSNIAYAQQAITAGANVANPKLMGLAGTKGNLEIVNAMLAAGANPSDALLPATKANHLGVVQKLLDSGAGGTAPELMVASVVHNSTKLTNLFLKAGGNAQAGMNAAVGANANSVLQLLLDEGGQAENPMLITAVKNNNDAGAKILMKEGLTGNMREASTGYTMLHYSAKNANSSLTYALLEHGAVVDAKTNGDTPLHFAVRNRKGLATVDALVSAGADVNAVNGKGKSVLKIAKGNKIKKLLKQNGASK